MFLIINLIFVGVFAILILVLKKSSWFLSNKIGTFECGFESIQNQRNTFSLRFFNLSILFLLFDMEMSLLFPLPTVMNFDKIVFFTSICLFFISMMIEWNQGSLEWK